jgi:hypothetical protein
MCARKRIGIALVVAMALSGAPPSVRAGVPARPADGVPFTGPVRIEDVWTASAVRHALAGASKRLDRPACQQVFDDFKDGEGRSLQDTLITLGDTGGSYINKKMLFYDGGPKKQCRSGVLAFTAPGSRVVYVCGEAFSRAFRDDRRFAEAVLIHEALHSLGLGENPPTSQAITAHVIRRCLR